MHYIAQNRSQQYTAITLLPNFQNYKNVSIYKRTLRNNQLRIAGTDTDRKSESIQPLNLLLYLQYQKHHRDNNSYSENPKEYKIRKTIPFFSKLEEGEVISYFPPTPIKCLSYTSGIQGVTHGTVLKSSLLFIVHTSLCLCS